MRVLYKSIGKSMLSRYAVYFVNAISMVLLAHVFTPEVFGTIAAAVVFFMLFQLIVEAGLSPAIINLNDLNNEDRDGIFTFTVIIGLMFAVLFNNLSPALVHFYKDPKVESVVPFISISLFFFSCGVVPNSLLLRDHAFYKISQSGIIAEITSTFLAIFFTHFINPIEALASKSTFNTFIQFALNWFFSKRTEFGRPEIGKKLSAIKPFAHFSSYQLGFNFINYFSRNLDNILVGKYLGVSSLGYYDRAYQIMRYPLMLLTFAMTPAIQPLIRKHSYDVRKIEEVHRELTFRLSMLGSLAGLFLFTFSDFFIQFIFGKNWIEVAPIIRILAISIPAQVVLSTSGSFFQAMERVDLMFKCGVFSASVTVSCIIFGIVSHDIHKLCWSLVFAFNVNFIQAYLTMYGGIYKISAMSFFLRMLPAAISVVVMVFCSLYYF